jgi:hypothetical protein
MRPYFLAYPSQKQAFLIAILRSITYIESELTLTVVSQENIINLKVKNNQINYQYKLTHYE